MATNQPAPGADDERLEKLENALHEAREAADGAAEAQGLSDDERRAAADRVAPAREPQEGAQVAPG